MHIDRPKFWGAAFFPISRIKITLVRCPYACRLYALWGAAFLPVNSRILHDLAHLLVRSSSKDPADILKEVLAGSCARPYEKIL